MTEATVTISFSTPSDTQRKLKELVWHFTLQQEAPVSQSAVITKAIDALYDQAIIDQSKG